MPSLIAVGAINELFREVKLLIPPPHLVTYLLVSLVLVHMALE
jgi:hypothetical protein